MTHIVRSAYGHKFSEGITFEKPSLTKQSFTKECNVNTIMEKYQKTGAIEHVNKNEASYGYASGQDFSEAMAIIATGKTMFEELPSSIRTKFQNDPAQFLDFVQDPNNLEEMRKLGLATQKSKTTPPDPLAKPQNVATATPEPVDPAKSGSE